MKLFLLLYEMAELTLKLRLEIEKTHSALEKACEYITEKHGTCPLDLYNAESVCQEKECDNNMAKCWKKYFLQENK